MSHRSTESKVTKFVVSAAYNLSAHGDIFHKKYLCIVSDTHQC